MHVPRILALAALVAGLALLLVLGQVDGKDGPAVGRGLGEDDGRGDVRLAGRGDAQTVAEDEAGEAQGESTEGTQPAKRGTFTVVVLSEASGAPVSGASVTIDGLYNDSGRRLEATTDAEGRARFADQTAIFGTVRVEAEGLGRAQRLISFRPGEDEEERIELPQAATIRGVVLDAATDRPIANAQVRLVGVDAPRMSKDPCFGLAATWDEVRTNARGEYAFEGCARNQQHLLTGVVASAEGYAPATKVAFTKDALFDEGGMVLGLPPAGRVEGRLVDARGEGVPGEVIAAPAHLSQVLGETQTVLVMPSGEPPWLGFEAELEGVTDLCGVWRVSTNEAGAFVFDDLPVGEEIVFVGLADGVRTPKQGLRIKRQNAAIKVGALDSGRIVVTVRDVDSRPIPRAAVHWRRFLRPNTDYPLLEDATSRTDASGRAVFPAGTPGPFSITIWGRGFGPTSKRGVHEPGDETEIRFEVRVEPPPPDDGSEPVHVDVGIPFRVGADETHARREPGTLRLTVELPVDAPLPGGYRIDYEGRNWSEDTSGPWPESGGRRLEVERECGDGLPATVEIRIVGYLPLRWEVADGAAGLVVLPTQTLDPGLVVTGRLADDAGRPVEGAEVSIGTPGYDGFFSEAGTIRRETKTDADGRFRLTALPAESLELVVVVPWHEHRQELAIHADLGPLGVTIPQRTVVTGRVLDRDGIPIAREKVSIRRPEAPFEVKAAWIGVTDRAGRFRAEIVPGRWEVRVRRYLGERPDRRWTTIASTEIETTPEQATTVVLEVDRAE